VFKISDDKISAEVEAKKEEENESMKLLEANSLDNVIIIFKNIRILKW
jgi:hypothetical protein